MSHLFARMERARKIAEPPPDRYERVASDNVMRFVKPQSANHGVADVDDVPRWRFEGLHGDVELRAFARLVRACIRPLAMLHDPEWFSELRGRDAIEKVILADREGENVVGLAMLSVSASSLEYMLGTKTLFRMPVVQYTLQPGPISVRSWPDQAVAACFDVLASGISAAGVVYANAVPAGSALHALFEDRDGSVHRRFHVLQWGNESAHCAAEWTGSVAEYLKSIGRESRKDLRKCARNLFSDETLRCRFKQFDKPQDIEEFLNDCVSVSDLTYQKRRLGMGISRGEWEESKIRFAAAQGGFLGYILYINERPAAFQYCFVKNGTCTLVRTGYDPAHASRQIGSVLFYQMLCEMEKSAAPIDILDFGPHASVFKLRTANKQTPILNYYLFSRTWRGACLFATLKLTGHLSEAGGRLLNRLGLKKPSGAPTRRRTDPPLEEAVIA